MNPVFEFGPGALRNAQSLGYVDLSESCRLPRASQKNTQILARDFGKMLFFDSRIFRCHLI